MDLREEWSKKCKDNYKSEVLYREFYTDPLSHSLLNNNRALNTLLGLHELRLLNKTPQALNPTHKNSANWRIMGLSK